MVPRLFCIHARAPALSCTCSKDSQVSSIQARATSYVSRHVVERPAGPEALGTEE